MTSPGSPPDMFTLIFARDIPSDLAHLHEVDDAILDAAERVLDDLAHGRVRGKLLGRRNVSGDLTGLARVNFDLPDHRPQRFRIVYRQVDDDTRHVIAIGTRDQHAIYLTVLQRISRETG